MTERRTIREHRECILSSYSEVGIDEMISFLQSLKETYAGKEVFLELSNEGHYDNYDSYELRLYERRLETEEELQIRINNENTRKLNREASDLTTKFLTGELPQGEYILKAAELRKKYFGETK